MGSLISSRRFYQSSKSCGHKRRRSHSPDPYRRCSTNRPVLQLEVKTETLCRHGITLTDGVSDMQRSSLRKLAHSGVGCEHLLPPPVTHGYRAHTPPPLLRHNLQPPSSLPPHTLPTPSLPPTRLPRRSHSVDALDSMIIIQYVANDEEEEGEKAGHTTESSHLARLTYAKMSDVVREEEHFGNITISRDGSPPRVTPSTSLGMINVFQRIQDHTHPSQQDHTHCIPSNHTHSTQPYHTQLGHTHSTQHDHTPSSSHGMASGTDESHRRSQTPEEQQLLTSKYSGGVWRTRSSDDLSEIHTNKKWTKIQSVSEDQVCSGMEWSLGESIMKAMSQNGLTLFDFDNPTSASEHEVNRAWPQLKEKMRIWRSQHSLDQLGSSSASEDNVFNPPPIFAH